MTVRGVCPAWSVAEKRPLPVPTLATHAANAAQITMMSRWATVPEVSQVLDEISYAGAGTAVSRPGGAGGPGWGSNGRFPYVNVLTRPAVSVNISHIGFYNF